jgi:hypothetical protein
MKTRLTLSLLAFVFAVGILLTSLATATQVNSSGNKPTGTRELYFNREILPDHMLYPALMAADRMKLETASNTDRIFLEIQYSNARLEMATQLLQQNKKDFAVSTLTKSLKYLEQAALEAQQHSAPSSVKNVIVRAIEYNEKETNKIMDQIPDKDQAAIKSLLDQNIVIATSLKN